MSNGGPPGRRIPAVVKQLGLVSFFNDLASEMVYPLLPALITTRLGAGALALGALDGIAEAVSASVKLGAGWLADRAPWRRPLIVSGYALAAVGRPLMGLAGAVWQVIGLRAVDRLGKGVRTPPRDAIIADATDPELRGRAFGYHRGMDHAGAVAGPIVAWFLIAGFDAAPVDVITWSVVPGMIAVLAVVWATRQVREVGAGGEREGRETENGKWETDKPFPALSRPRPPSTVFFLIVAFAFARFPETLLLLRIQELGVAVALVPIAWAAMHVVRAVASYPGGGLSDRIGPSRTMLLGWLIYAVVCVGLATAPGGGTAFAWFLLFGLVAPATEAPERAFVAAAARAARRGRGFGIYHASVGLAALPGSLFLAALYSEVGAPAALLGSGGLAMALAVVGMMRRGSRW